MSFMEPQVTEKMVWVEAETDEGTIYVPLSDWEEDFGKKVQEIEGFGARLSAPGYMDCTEWTVFETAAEAASYLLDTYYDMADDETAEDQKAEIAELEEIVNAR